MLKYNPRFSASRKLFKLTVFKLIATIFIFISFYITKTNSQSINITNLPNEIKLYIRDDLPVFGENTNGRWSGFCAVFGHELQKELRQLSNNPNFTVSINATQNKTSDKFRLDGLITDDKKLKYDIQCGPNSKGILEFLEQEGMPQYKERIIESNIFYETNIKLLIRKKVWENFNLKNKLPQEILDILKKKLNVGVVEKTTTQEQLSQHFTGIKLFKSLDDATIAFNEGMPGEKEMDALASDGIIVKYKSDHYCHPRKPCVIYPENNQVSLGTQEQKYFIAISNYGGTQQYSATLQETINNLIDRSNVIRKEIEKLKQYENERHWEPLIPLILTGVVFLIFAIVKYRNAIGNSVSKFVRRILSPFTNR
ncbi:hypothetical protein NIES4101_68890 [Calothrix sp. NIES-4101]|nr:hypothetical protein NIES4101_68890 [Calothrix sp. NIES-4101]